MQHGLQSGSKICGAYKCSQFLPPPTKICDLTLQVLRFQLTLGAVKLKQKSWFHKFFHRWQLAGKEMKRQIRFHRRLLVVHRWSLVVCLGVSVFPEFSFFQCFESCFQERFFQISRCFHIRPIREELLSFVSLRKFKVRLNTQWYNFGDFFGKLLKIKPTHRPSLRHLVFTSYSAD